MLIAILALHMILDFMSPVFRDDIESTCGAVGYLLSRIPFPIEHQVRAYMNLIRRLFANERAIAAYLEPKVRRMRLSRDSKAPLVNLQSTYRIRTYQSVLHRLEQTSGSIQVQTSIQIDRSGPRSGAPSYPGIVRETRLDTANHHNWELTQDHVDGISHRNVLSLNTHLVYRLGV
jgi:hypothetical protein